MNIADLGRLDGPVVLWGGALGNLSALRALRDAVDAAGISAGNVIATGDLAGYCAEGEACADAVRRLGWSVVAGNVERQLAAEADACGCGFATGSACDRMARPWWDHARATLSPGTRNWMDALPDLAVFIHGARRYAVIHGGATDIARFLWPVSRQPEFAEEVAAIEGHVGPVDGIIAGHCGLAFQRVVAGRHWVNAGAIGMPPNNGVPGGQYVRLDATGAHILRLSYDPTSTVAAMRRAGLTQGYDRALETGLWPSEEILPFEMRRGLTVA
ncbi:metallophosphoesterase [Maritimibacter sp. UBA3975]|uniref:metallophosphoesterase family protein n=1 Tax=Maritimibacter sp. UBA3975 TaxID=1946833 RepID=UPI000C0AC4BA|nr:metallophosphoesterase [Maritimibacter sp. UBA3975]MAM60234.1 diadenosine tetraphosphatase [Maritimibacter sp.]|tara:strand:- start:4097 stop:4912 length:816 start_codon:yes stop_codon:yes gene_type:complete